LLFGERKLAIGGWNFEAERDSSGAVIKSAAFNVKGCSSSAVASELTGIKSCKGKLKSAFVFN
jgi:NifU-like protein involved in Fe-S cluster formation